MHAPSGLLACFVTRKPTAVASAIARATERASITTNVNATSAGRESAAIATRAKPSAIAAITARASALTNASAMKVGEDRAARFPRALMSEIALETVIALHRISALAPVDFPASTVRRRPIVRSWTIARETVSVWLRTGRNTVRATRVTRGQIAASRRAPVGEIALGTEPASKSICVTASTATRVLTAASFLAKQRSFVQVQLMPQSFFWVYIFSLSLGHGKCLALDTCTCDSKWTGPECRTPDCSAVNNCGNVSTGVCIGPDTCQCTAHYDGPRCDQLGGINQHSPAFNVSSIDVALPLTAAIGFVVVSEPALDMDSGKNGRITYSLTSSDGRHSLFKVDAQTGVIVTAASLRSYVGDVFLFTLSATDSGVPSLTGNLQISLTVTQPNLHCPVFVGLLSSVDVDEMAPPGTNVVQLSATDKDGKASPNGRVKYSLDALASDRFKIDSQSGLVTLTRSLSDEAYILNVVASDHGQPQCHTMGKVDVKVISLNHAPQCIPGSLTTFVPYTTNASTALFTLEATDIDSGAAGRLSYNLTNFQSTSLSRNLFDVVTNDSTGADVILRSSPPKPSGLFNLATFSVAVRDQSSSPKSCTFRLTVTIADNFEFVSSKAIARLAEDAPVQSIVPVTPRLSLRTNQLNASRISYSLYYAESLPFSVHAKTGVLSLSKALDYEQQKEYNINILAQTSEVPGAVTVATVRISVTNVNDNAPEFEQRQYAFLVAEQTKGGAMLLSLTATDSDVGSDRTQIEYQLVSVVPSDSEDVFEIKRSSAGGVGIYLSDDAVLNYFSTDKYTLVIRALDKQNPSLYGEVTVLVFVNKSNAKGPLFDQGQYSITLKENSPDGSSVLSVKALVDGKPSTNVMYSIRSQEFKSGSRANAFTITNSGVLQVANSVQLDYENVREIAVVIVASLTEPVLRTSETTAVISLSDVNDNSPMFSKEVYAPSDVVVGLPRGFSVVNTSAIDADSGKAFFR